jgi:hypothetical protein
MAMNIRKRLSVKDIMTGARVSVIGEDGNPELNDNGTPKTRPLSLNDPQDLFVITGKAKSSKEGNTTYGRYVEFQGPMYAKRFIDGEEYTGNAVLFPPPTDMVVENNFLAAKSKDPNAEFGMAFVIGVEAHKHGEETKYRYTCKPINVGDQAASDPLADLKAAIEAERPGLLGSSAPARALAAPTVAPEPELESEPTVEALGKGRAGK